MNKHHLVALLFTAGLHTSTLEIHADAVALEFMDGSPQFFPGYTVGWSFSLTAPVTVTSLGWYDEGADGLLSSHSVGLFTQPAAGDGTLLASATVDSGDLLQGSFRFDAITPVTLLPGNYIVAGTSGQDSFQAFCSGVVTDPGVSYSMGHFISTQNETLTFPTSPSDRGTAYFGPNFTVVPEPSVATLILTPAAIALLRRRR